MKATSLSTLCGATLCFSSLIACSTSTDGAESPSSEPEVGESDADDPAVSGLNDGQSGSEGLQLRMPCYFEEQAVFTAVITSTAGGCFEGEIMALHSDGAETSSFAEGDTVGGMMQVFYNSSEVAEGDTVVIQYVEGPNGESAPLSGYVQVSPMVGEKVEIEWLGGTYEYSVDELLDDGCADMINALPNLIEEEPGGEDPDDGKPPAESPLSCPAE